MLISCIFLVAPDEREQSDCVPVVGVCALLPHTPPRTREVQTASLRSRPSNCTGLAPFHFPELSAGRCAINGPGRHSFACLDWASFAHALKGLTPTKQ